MRCMRLTSIAMCLCGGTQDPDIQLGCMATCLLQEMANHRGRNASFATTVGPAFTSQISILQLKPGLDPRLVRAPTQHAQYRSIDDWSRNAY